MKLMNKISQHNLDICINGFAHFRSIDQMNSERFPQQTKTKNKQTEKHVLAKLFQFPYNRTAHVEQYSQIM